MLHFSIAWPLPELHAELIEALARLLNVVDGDRDVSEPTAGIGVSISVPLEVGVRFGPVVVGEPVLIFDLWSGVGLKYRDV